MPSAPNSDLASPSQGRRASKAAKHTVLCGIVDNPPAPLAKRKGKTMEKQEFINYLTETLIPDLMESGHVATAQDFMRAVWFLENPDAKEVHDNDLPPTL